MQMAFSLVDVLLQQETLMLLDVLCLVHGHLGRQLVAPLTYFAHAKVSAPSCLFSATDTPFAGDVGMTYI